MATDLIRYDLLVQDALRGVVKTVLADAARNGLKGDHHFFITFRTDAEGLRLSDRMRERYPEEMTIILQHQFWELAVNDDSFEVNLSFSNKSERLLVPFAAITTFHDPSVQFGLKFDLAEQESDDDAAEDETRAAAKAAKPALAAVETPLVALPTPVKPAASKPEPKPAKPALAKVPPAAEPPSKEKVKAEPGEPQKVVSIDAFRKKP